MYLTIPLLRTSLTALCPPKTYANHNKIHGKNTQTGRKTNSGPNLPKKFTFKSIYQAKIRISSRNILVKQATGRTKHNENIKSAMKQGSSYGG